MAFSILSTGANLLSLGGQNSAERKALAAANKQKWQQTLQQYNAFSLQNSLAARQTGTALFNIQQQGDTARAGVQLQSAASDTIGASVQDALSTINVAQDRQEAGTMQDFELQTEERSRQMQGAIAASGAEIQASISSLKRQQANSALSTAAQLGLEAAAPAIKEAGANYAKNALEGSNLGKFAGFVSKYL